MNNNHNFRNSPKRGGSGANFCYALNMLIIFKLSIKQITYHFSLIPTIKAPIIQIKAINDNMNIIVNEENNCLKPNKIGFMPNMQKVKKG